MIRHDKFKPLDIRLFCLVFMVGATRFFDFTIIARIPLAEIIAFSSVPFILRSGNLSRIKILPAFSLFMLWAISVMISDLVNESHFELFIRGVLKPVFSAMWMLFFIGVLLRDFRALNALPFGLFVAAHQNYFAPRGYSFLEISGEGYAAIAVGIVPICISGAIVGATLVYKKSRLLASLCFIIFAIVLLAVGAPRNSPAIFLLVSFCLILLAYLNRGGSRYFKLTATRLVLIFLGGLLVSLAIYYIYVFVASSGYLGIEREKKLLTQATTVFGASPIGLILDGRTYVFAAILGIWDNPIFGFGSWSGIFMEGYFVKAVMLIETDTSYTNALMQDGGGRAGHSVLFTAWLENGILAAIALIAIYYIMLIEFINLIRADNRFAPLLISMFLIFSWAFFFSPFGIPERMTIGLFLAFNALRFNHQKNPKRLAQR